MKPEKDRMTRAAADQKPNEVLQSMVLLKISQHAQLPAVSVEYDCSATRIS